MCLSSGNVLRFLGPLSSSPLTLLHFFRGFRQKHTPILSGQPGGEGDEDDNSTIASDFAESLDDKGVYLQCRKDQNVMDSLFSGPLFAEISWRNCGRKMSDGPVFTLPPVGAVERGESGGDVSDLDSVTTPVPTPAPTPKLMHKKPVHLRSRRKR